MWGSSDPLCCKCTWDSNLHFTWMSCTLHNCTVHNCTVHNCTVHSCTLHNCTVHNCTCIIQYVDLSRAAREEGIPSLFATILYFGAAEHISFLKYKTVYIHIPCCQNIPRVDDQFSCHRIESLQSHDLFLDPGSSGQTIPVASWDFLWRSSSIHLLYLQQKTFSQNYGSHILLS